MSDGLSDDLSLHIEVVYPHLSSELIEVCAEVLEDESKPVEADIEVFVVLLHHLLPVVLGEVLLTGGEHEVCQVCGRAVTSQLSWTDLTYKGGVQKFMLNRLVDFSIKWVGGVSLVH